MPHLLAISSADAHALTMVAILAFALGSLVTMFFIMARNAKRNAELNLPEFPEELLSQKKTSPSKRKKEEPRSEWERDADWWK